MEDETWPSPRLAGDAADLEAAASFLRLVEEAGNLKSREKRSAAAGLRAVAARLPKLAADLESEADEEDLKNLSGLASAALLSQGWTSSDVDVGPPLEQWHLTGAGGGGLEALATRSTCRLHLAKTRDGRLAGLAETEVKRGQVELVGVGPAGPVEEALRAALTRLRELRPETNPPRLLACARPRLRCLWLHDRAELVPYHADDPALFTLFEPLSESDALARLTAGGYSTETSLRFLAARLELVRRVVDHNAGRPATRAHLLQHARDVVSAVDGTTPVPKDIADRFGLPCDAARDPGGS